MHTVYVLFSLCIVFISNPVTQYTVIECSTCFYIQFQLLLTRHVLNIFIRISFVVIYTILYLRKRSLNQIKLGVYNMYSNLVSIEGAHIIKF